MVSHAAEMLDRNDVRPRMPMLVEFCEVGACVQVQSDRGAPPPRERSDFSTAHRIVHNWPISGQLMQIGEPVSFFWNSMRRHPVERLSRRLRRLNNWSMLVAVLSIVLMAVQVESVWAYAPTATSKSWFAPIAKVFPAARRLARAGAATRGSSVRVASGFQRVTPLAEPGAARAARGGPISPPISRCRSHAHPPLCAQRTTLPSWPTRWASAFPSRAPSCSCSSFAGTAPSSSWTS